MNSGKSTALMQVAHNYAEREMDAVILKPRTDTKGGDTVVSRLGVVRKVDLVIEPEEDLFAKLSDRVEKEGPLHCVLVDEAQFLKKEHVDQLFKVAVLLDVPVICYGLRTDFKMNGFEGSQRLLLLAHAIEELKTICRCGRKAVLNGRKMGGQFVFEGDQVAIDGENAVTYESLCATCYYEYQHRKRKV